MKKKILAFLLTTIMVLSTNIIAFAGTKSTTSTFSANSSQINGTPIIIVPEEMQLIYDENTASYMCKDKVIVYGHIDSSRQVDVFVNKRVTYTNTVAQGSNEIEGYVTFGKSYNTTQNLGFWTQSDCAAGLTADDNYDEENAVKKTIIASILPKDILNIGDYEATIEYIYDANIIGMTSSIVGGNAGSNIILNEISAYTSTNNKQVYPTAFNLSDSEASEKVCYGFGKKSGTNFINLDTNINLANCAYENMTNKASKYVDNAWLEKNIFTGIIDNSTSIPSYTDSLKTIELSKDLYYWSDVQIDTDNDMPKIRSAFCQTFFASWYSMAYKVENYFLTTPRSIKNLQTIIIPEGFTSDNFRKYSTDAPNTTLRNSIEVIGNATFFIKNIDEDGKFIYVPNIVFRGPTDKWMKLSGHEDWTFGNIGNIVTVYCTDGEVVYQ